MSKTGDFRKLVRDLEARGFRVEVARGSVYNVTAPGGQHVCKLSRTSPAEQERRKAASALRRRGVQL